MTVIVFYSSLSTILNVHCFNDHQEIQMEGDEIQAKYIKIYNIIYYIVTSASYYGNKTLSRLISQSVYFLNLSVL